MNSPRTSCVFILSIKNIVCTHLLCNEIKDTFLDIEDIKRVGVSLRNNLTLLQIDLALHDIFLCPKPFRDKSIYKKMFSWLLQIQEASILHTV
jgi:hypothetical protein